MNNNTLYQLSPDEPDARWRSIGPGNQDLEMELLLLSEVVSLLQADMTRTMKTINAVQVYDGRSWNKLPATLNTARSDSAAVFLGDDLVVFGGHDHNCNALSSVECLFTRHNLFERRLRRDWSSRTYF